MKNKTALCLLAVLLVPLAARAQGRQVNVVGTVGMATGNIERLIVNLGIEMEVFRHFYAQVGIDNFLELDSMTGYYYREGRIMLSPRMQTRVFGMNILGTYKLPLARRIAWFTKAGLSYSFRSRYYNNNYYDYGYGDYGYGYGDYYDYYPGPSSGEDESPMQTGLAYTLGTGLEYRLTGKLALIGGGSYESLFAQPTTGGENGGPGDWVKFYIGFNYRVR